MGQAGHKTKVSVSDELLQPATNGRPQLESRQWIFLRRPGDVSIMWCCGQNQQFVTGSRTVSIHDFGNQNSHFKPDHYFFWNPNQVVMCLNLIRGISTASLQRRDGTFYLKKHKVATQRNVSVVLQTRTQLTLILPIGSKRDMGASDEWVTQVHLHVVVQDSTQVRACTCAAPCSFSPRSLL